MVGGLWPEFVTTCRHSVLIGVNILLCYSTHPTVLKKLLYGFRILSNFLYVLVLLSHNLDTGALNIDEAVTKGKDALIENGFVRLFRQSID